MKRCTKYVKIQKRKRILRLRLEKTVSQKKRFIELFSCTAIALKLTRNYSLHKNSRYFLDQKGFLSVCLFFISFNPLWSLERPPSLPLPSKKNAYDSYLLFGVCFFACFCLFANGSFLKSLKIK